MNDKIEFEVYDLVSNTLALHPFEAIVSNGWSPDLAGYMKSTGSGALYIPIPLKEGDRINGVTIAACGTGSVNLTMTVYVYSGSGGKTSIGTIIWAPSTSWSDVALALTSTTLVAGQSLYINFFAAATDLRIGTARVHYDRP